MAREGTNTETPPQHGRYYAQYIRLGLGAESQKAIQDILESGARRGWELVGVTGGLQDETAVLFWNTEAPRFAGRHS